MMSRTGLALTAVDHDAPPPGTAAEIIGAYQKAVAELVEAIKTNWSDETLSETDEMYGMEWSRGLTLSILIHHEIHHRGQLTVLLRQAGQTVPGLMGPSKEEWEQYGQQAPPY